MTTTDATRSSSHISRQVAFEAAAGALCLTVQAFGIALVFAYGLLELLGRSAPYLAESLAAAAAAISGWHLYRLFRANLRAAETPERD